MAFEWFIGTRYLRAKRAQTFISIITVISIAGVTVGVMALIVVIAVMTGFETDLREKILGVTSHVVVMQHGGGIEDHHALRKRVEKIDGVIAATPFTYTQVMLKSASKVSGAILRGIEPQTAGRVVDIEKNLTEGSLKALEEPTRSDESFPGRPGGIVPGIILGRELAMTLGVREGDVVYVISPRGMLTPIGQVPGMKRFRVSGIFKSGMYEYDSSLAYIGLHEAQKILRMGDKVTGIEIRVRDIYEAGSIAQLVEDSLGYPFWTRDWMRMNRNLFSALKLEKTAMFIILTLIVLVAAFNIAGTLIMMVMDKNKDIAILKSMGATSRSIKKIFVYEGLIIGIVGTFLGVCGGALLCWLLAQYKFIELPGDVYYISTLPVRMKFMDVAIISVGAIAISFLATLYPARQAARLDPVQALRYE
ncbi:MAG: lipoprotein-releasing ABC transporter permease subunit [Deltaproteobacteria bacterium]|nr:lipoprotein-releasing ABC transporter permease subunit [Deltaproteobacteria bacterium]